ncbi:putative bifunctional diguanylate cyclase/phosphodiesterase, partial [Cellulomonas cellasea]
RRERGAGRGAEAAAGSRTASVDVGPLFYELRAVPERPLDDGVESVLVAAREMTRRRDAERRLGHAAMHDPLTGLANRVLVRERAEWMLGTRGRGVAVLLLDLDRFKLVNDSYGHGLGDELLVLAAQRAERLSPRGGTVGRLGGDEFVIVVPDTSRARTEELARAVVEAFDEPFVLHDEEFTVGCSLGVVHSGDRAQNWDELLRLADVAMYRAKAAGGACFRWFEEGLGDTARQRLQLAADLRRAAGSDELGVAYQPEVDLRTGQAIAVEALMRWSTPTRGNVPPCEFIPVAEETGLIVGLGRWIMHDAVVAVAEHNRRTSSDVRMWVNVSARQLTGPDVAAGIVELLRELDVPTRWLGIEVTESVLADDERVLPTLVALRDAGIGVAVDDFGTGYSSFARLRDYPVTLLKIDRAFVQGLADPSPEAAERAAHIVRAVVAVGRALGADVVAEGVEDVELLRHVRTLGCDLAQGYVFGRPGTLAGAMSADGHAGQASGHEAPAGVR